MTREQIERFITMLVDIYFQRLNSYDPKKLSRLKDQQEVANDFVNFINIITYDTK